MCIGKRAAGANGPTIGLPDETAELAVLKVLWDDSNLKLARLEHLPGATMRLPANLWAGEAISRTC